jgi:hypothetical protein
LEDAAHGSVSRYGSSGNTSPNHGKVELLLLHSLEVYLPGFRRKVPARGSGLQPQHVSLPTALRVEEVSGFPPEADQVSVFSFFPDT